MLTKVDSYNVNLIRVYSLNDLGLQSGYVTVSAGIPSWLKELLDKYGIKPGPMIRGLLRRKLVSIC